VRPLKILFVRAPRKLWVYINEDDNFWMPLNFPCLSAVLKKHLSPREIEIKALDCCAKQIGWNSLSRILKEEKADIVGFGDETCYSEEGLHLAHLAREANPNCLIVAGGSHFPHVAGEVLPTSAIDITVIGEGEYTFLELVQEILSGAPDFSRVKGLAYLRDGRVILNDPRPIIPNLDDLPLPDYDLMGFDNYGKGGVLWAFPGAVPLFHSRGCFSGCTFCAFWPSESQWHRNAQGDLVPVPTYRTKSVERTIVEMDILYQKYGRRFFSWTDGTFNAESEWNDRWAEEVLRRGWDIKWFAFQRADCLARDEKKGILEKMVRAGMAYTIVGVERHRDEDYQTLHKVNYSTHMVKETCRLIRRKYPHVFLHGTFLIGLEDDTREELLRLSDFAVSIGLDFASFHFLSPAPGTLLHSTLKSEGKTSGLNYSAMDWFTPLWPTRYLDLDQLNALQYTMMKRFMTRRLGFLPNLINTTDHKRSMYLWFLRKGLNFMWSEAKHRLLGHARGLTLQPPNWYNS